MGSFIEKLMRLSPSKPYHVARKVVKIAKAKNPPLRVSGTLDAYLFGHVRRWIPRALYHWILYRSLPGIRRWGKD
jgi:hypothetical protein